MDLFQKCQDYTAVKEAVAAGIYPYFHALESGQVRSVSELARQEGQERTFLFRALSLVDLAPDIIQAIVKGTEPDKLSLARLRKAIPDDWDEQRQLFGMTP